MIIYKDRISGDEMFTDIYPMKLVFDGMMYDVEGKTTTESTEISDSLIGGNASAEGGAEETDPSSETGCSIVLANRLKQTPPYDKKSFLAYMSGYSKRVLASLEEEDADKDEDKKRAPVFKKNMGVVVKSLVKRLKTFEFFTGENMDQDGMVALLDYREDGITPYMLFFKDGLIEEKV